MIITKFVKNSFGLYFDYKKNSDEIEEDISFKSIFVISAIVVFICNLILNVFDVVGSTLSGYQLILFVLKYSFYDFMIIFIFLFISSLMIFGVLKLFKGKVSYLNFNKYFVSINFPAYFVSFFIMIFSEFVYFFLDYKDDSAEYMNFLNVVIWIYIIVMLVVFVASVVLQILIFSKACDISKLKTSFAVLLPFFLYIVFVLVLWFLYIQPALVLMGQNV